MVDVFGYNCSGADDDAVADGYGKYGGVAADGDLVADLGLREERTILRGRASVFESVVDEHDTVANEAVVADGDEFADEGVRLDPRLGSDAGIGLDFDEWAYEGVVADGAVIEVDGLYDSDVFAEADVFDLGCMDVRSIGHDRTTLILLRLEKRYR